jgi:hypothetical protein
MPLILDFRKLESLLLLYYAPIQNTNSENIQWQMFYILWPHYVVRLITGY